MFTILGEMNSLLQTSNTKSIGEYVRTAQNSFNLPSASQLFPSLQNYLIVAVIVVALPAVMILVFKIYQCRQKCRSWAPSRLTSRRRRFPQASNLSSGYVVIQPSICATNDFPMQQITKPHNVSAPQTSLATASDIVTSGVDKNEDVVVPLTLPVE